MSDEKMVAVLTSSVSLSKKASPVSRLMIPVAEYEEDVELAEKHGRPVKYIRDDDYDPRPCFDGLSKKEQDKVLVRQSERQAQIDALEQAKENAK